MCGEHAGPIEYIDYEEFCLPPARGDDLHGVAFALPPVLRPTAGGARTVEAGGDSLRAALDDLTGQHPACARRLLDDDGEINAFVNVYVEGEDVRSAAGSRRRWPPTPA